MKKFIITRIGLNFPEKDKIDSTHLQNNPDYIAKTIMDMLDFTYPSIKNQTAKEIVWVFFTGSRFTDNHRKLIEDVVEVPIVFIKDIEYRQTKKPWEHEESIVMRLDADDFMHPTLIEKVEKNLLEKYTGDNIVICSPEKGYKLYPDLSLTEFQTTQIALGLGVISNCGAGVLHDHSRLVQTYNSAFPNKEVIINNIVSDEKLYLYRRHEMAHSFACDLNYKDRVKIDNPLEILNDFGVLKTIYWKKRNV